MKLISKIIFFVCISGSLSSCLSQKFGEGVPETQPVGGVNVSFSGFSVPSPSNEIPRINGAAGSAVDDVEIYTDDECLGVLFATGTRAQFVGNGIILPMGTIQNVQTTFYGKGISEDSEGPCTELSSFTYDATPPSNPVIPPGEDNQISASITTSPVYTWSASTDPGGGSVEYAVSIGTEEVESLDDLLPWEPIGNLRTYTASETFVIDTTYFFRVKAVDEAGNESEISVVSWLVSNSKLALGIATSNPTTNSSVINPVISGLIPVPSGDDVDSVRVFNNDSCSDSGTSGGITNLQLADLTRVQFLSPGTAITVPSNEETTFYARAYDTNDTPGECVPLNLVYRHDSIDPTAPSGFVNAPTSSDLDQSPVFTWEAGTDTDGSGLASYSYSISDNTNSSIVANSTGNLGSGVISFRVTGISLQAPRSYTFKIKSIDLAGNESAEGTATWTVSAVPVENPVTITYPSTNEIIRTPTRNISGTCDPGGLAVQISANSSVSPTSVACDPDGTYVTKMNFSGSDATVTIDAQQENSTASRTVKYDIPFKGQAGFGGARIHAIAYGLGPAAGKIYVGGEFVTYKGKPQRYIVRLNSDGSVDETFQAATSITTNNGFVYAVLPLEDGGAILGGAFTEYKLSNTDASETAALRSVNRIVRVTNTGARDTSFTTNGGSIAPVTAANVGFTSASAVVRSLAFVDGPSGDEIYVGGTFTAYRGAVVSSHFTRLDLTTGVKNAAVTYANFDAAVLKILPHPSDDSVFVGGFFRHYGAASDANKVSRLARIDATGALVAGFNNGAISGLDNSVTTLTVSAVKALAFDDPASPTRLYVGGTFNNYKGATTPSSLIALELSGNIDTNFNNGDVAPYGATKSSVLAIEVDANGDVYIGGDFTTVDGVTRNKIAKLDDQGSIYSTNEFKVSGGFSVTAGHGIGALALNPDHTTSLTNLKNDLIVGGLYTSFNGQAYGSIMRMKFNADPDNFVDQGRPPVAASILVVKAVPDNSGDVYVGGCFVQWGADTSLKYLVKLDINGNIDTTFKPNLNGCVYDIVFDVDNASTMYIGGAFTSVEGAGASKIAKLNLGGTSGSLRDTTFITNIGTGFTHTTLGLGTTVGAGSYVTKILQDPDVPTNLYVGGNFTFFNTVAKKGLHQISSDGSTTAFNAAVFASATVTAVLDLKWSSSDQIYVAGNFTGASGRNHILRMNKDGSHDASFNPTPGGQPSAMVKSVLPLTNGQLYMGGDFISVRGNTYNRIVLLNSNGSIDTSFGVAGASGGLSGPVEVIAGGVSATAGRIFTGGLFASANSSVANHIAYFEANGTLVTKIHSGDYFDSGTGFTGTTPGIRTIEESGDGTGRVWVGGLFTVYDGYTRNSLLRLCSDGSME